MNNKIIIAAVAALVIIVGVVVLMASNNSTAPTTETVDTSRNNDEQPQEETEIIAQEENDITYKGFAVSPSTITVKKGTTVTWTNQDDAQHDVTPDEETADFKASELFGKGETYAVTFNTPGMYAYHCSPHPYMKGTIEVTE